MSRTSWMAGAAVASLVLAGGASAEEAWETVQETPQRIKVRAIPDSSVQEVWAEADLDVAVRDVESALMDVDHFKDFFPYVKESRALGKPLPDGSAFSYVRLDFGALATSRDYIVQVWFDKGSADGGVFANHWVAAPDHLPKRSNAIRVRTNSGSYLVTPAKDDPEKCHVVYRFIVDPGGWIPSFAANIGNKSAVSDTLSAVEREAKRRAKERKAKAATPPPPVKTAQE